MGFSDKNHLIDGLSNKWLFQKDNFVVKIQHLLKKITKLLIIKDFLAILLVFKLIHIINYIKQRSNMNNLKKLGLTALAGSLAVTGANATEYAVTGDAVLKYASIDYPAGAESTLNGKGLGVDTDLYFNASGELDNGFTVAFFQAADTNGAWTNSSSQVTIGMGSLGTLKLNKNCWCCW